MLALAFFFLLHAHATGGQSSIDAVLKQVSAARLVDRERGIESLREMIAANPSLRTDADVRRVVISVLAEENELIDRNLSAITNHEPALISEGFGEQYSELLGIALDLLDAPAAPSEKGRLLAVLVRSTYNPDSSVPDRLVDEGDLIVAETVAMARSTNGPSRWNAYSLIERLLLRSDSGTVNVPLTAVSRQQLREAARAGLRDPAADVRRYAIRAVVAARDREAIPLLDELARVDPDSGQDKETVLAQNSVRYLAAVAAKTLRSIR